MKLHEIMTRDVRCVDRDATLTEAAAIMRKMDVGSLPVCDGEQLSGVITDRDIVIRAVAQGVDPSDTRVREAMTEDAFYCYEDQDVQDAVALMEDKQIRRIPVLDRQSHLCGIVSLGDIAVDLHQDELSGEVLERVSEPAQPMREPSW